MKEKVAEARAIREEPVSGEGTKKKRQHTNIEGFMVSGARSPIK